MTRLKRSAKNISLPINCIVIHLLLTVGFVNGPNHDFKDNDRGAIWQSSNSLCGHQRNQNDDMDLRTKFYEDADHEYQWVCAALAKSYHIMSASLKYKGLWERGTSLNPGTELFVTMDQIDFGSEHCKNRQLWERFTLANTVSWQTAFKFCSDFSRDYPGADNYKIAYCGYAATRLMMRVLPSSQGRIDFVELAVQDDQLEIVYRLKKSSTSDTWQSSGYLDSCFHLRTEDQVRKAAAADQSEFYHTADAEAHVGGFHWFIASFNHPRLIGYVRILLGAVNPSDTYNVEVWASLGLIDFGHERCNTGKIDEIHEKLIAENSPKKFTFCDRFVGMIPPKFKWWPECKRWAHSILIRQPIMPGVKTIGRYNDIGVYDAKYSNVRAELFDCRRVAFPISWQSSSPSRATCLFQSVKSAGNRFILRFRPGHPGDDGFHWFAVRMPHTWPVSYVVLTTDTFGTHKPEIWTSTKSINFGTDSCQTTGMLKIFNQHVGDGDESLKLCLPEHYKVDKYRYVLCDRWIRTIFVRIPTGGNVSMYENVAALSGAAKPDRFTAEKVTHNAVTLSWFPPTQMGTKLKYQVVCVVGQSPTILEGSGTICKPLPAATIVTITVFGFVNDNAIRGEAILVIRMPVAPVTNLHVVKADDNCVSVAWKRSIGPDISHRLICPNDFMPVRADNTSGECCSLTRGIFNRIRVVAWKTGFNDSVPVDINVTTTLPPPEQLTFASSNHTCARVVWLKAPIKKIRYRVACPSNTQPAFQHGGMAECCGLNSNSDYSVSVTTVKANFTSKTETVKVRTGHNYKHKPSVAWPNDNTACLSQSTANSGFNSISIRCPFGSTATTSTRHPNHGCCAGLSGPAVLIVEGRASFGTANYTVLVQRPQVKPDGVREVSQSEEGCVTISWSAVKDPSIFYEATCPVPYAKLERRNAVRCCELDDNTRYEVSVVARRAGSKDSEPGTVSFTTMVYKPRDFRFAAYARDCATLAWSPARVAGIEFGLSCPNQGMRRIRALRSDCCGLTPNTNYTATLVALAGSTRSVTETLRITTPAQQQPGSQSPGGSLVTFGGGIGTVIVVVICVKIVVITLCLLMRS